MLYTNHAILCCLMLACCSFFIVYPVHAFTANSLDIVVDKNGDALATFHFTLEGIIENAIPESVLQEELIKGLTTSSDPPELKSMDKSSAVLLMKKFADTSDVPTGTEYRTATMDFKKAEIALQNSGLSGAVTADFSPDSVTVTFPDSYKKVFSNVDVLPAIFHTIDDPVKVAQVQAAAKAQAQGSSGAKTTSAPGTSTSTKGSVNVTSSPLNVKVSVDSQYLGESPAIFDNIGAGTHVMQFTKDGFEPVSKNVTIVAGRTTNVMVVLKYIPSSAPEETSSFPWLPLVIVLIGLIAVGIGGYYYRAEKKKNEWGAGVMTPAGKNGKRDPAGKVVVSGDIIDVPKEITGVPKETPAKSQQTVPVTPEAGSTIVRVTLLKEIPDKEKGDADTKDKHD